MSGPIGVYVHWPYCHRICPYCDFNVVRERGHSEQQIALGHAIVEDLRGHAELIGRRELVSIYFGGGTPSLMAPRLANQIIETCARLWAPVGDVEVTLEANPTDAEAARFAAFAEAGVNRLSLGLQSLEDASLKFLGRNHDVAAGLRAAEIARTTFPRCSIDLIYALPNQTPQAWRDELRAAVALGAEHLSAYQLTIEPGVPFDRLVRRGRLAVPGPDLAAELFETTDVVLADAGLGAYEVSNHARGAAARGRHNLIYWQGGEYLGVGPGAHGRLNLPAGRYATVTPRPIDAYLAAVSQHGAGSNRERLGADEIASERMIMALRTTEGVWLDDLAALALDERVMADLVEAELITLVDRRLAITRQGRPLTDRITLELAMPRANGA